MLVAVHFLVRVASSAEIPVTKHTRTRTLYLKSAACPDYDGSTVCYPAHVSTGALIKAHSENIQILAKKEERIRYITSLVRAQLDHFGTSPEAGADASKLGTKRPANSDAVPEDSVDMRAARDFRMALARHHPNVRTDPSTRQRLAIEGMKGLETGKRVLDDTPKDRVAAAAVEIRLLLMLSFILCVLALFFIYQAAFPRKRLGPRGGGLSTD